MHMARPAQPQPHGHHKPWPCGALTHHWETRTGNEILHWQKPEEPSILTRANARKERWGGLRGGVRRRGTFPGLRVAVQRPRGRNHSL